ncbi:hypothetical protein JIR001_05440 [Polycladomyces abyssicola]|uniref:Uncharacterized protein n=1 Tax=Polycladomyces abyssicola TaxID=1125966 RepID=A0A8D5ZMV0_9BACL|nr:hypothetical protein [Polycladomyces abyssicola]BCU80761.1 hypothetical protein JIR001_05440 [Polycladomyces abyssicola]
MADTDKQWLQLKGRAEGIIHSVSTTIPTPDCRWQMTSMRVGTKGDWQAALEQYIAATNDASS